MLIRQIKIWLMFSALILISALAISAQSDSGGAKTTPETQNAADDLHQCSQMLDQSLAEARALKLYAAQLEKLVEIQNSILAKKDEEISEQKKLIAIYEKRKGTKISFLFGLIKFTKN